jgi:uncharacterized protein involved in exopolysaccharide biosynthesis
MEKMGASKSPNRELRALTLRDMAGPLFRNGRAVIVTFCSILAISITLGWAWAHNYYVSSMQVFVTQERSDPKVTGQQNGPLLDNTASVTADEVTSEIALLQGRDMLREVVRTCKLAKESASFLGSSRTSDSENAAAEDPKVVERATNRLAAKLAVEAPKNSHIIDVKYGSSGAPETPACVLQTLAKLYLAKHLRLQRPQGAYDFFAAETEKYEQALAQSEKRLADFSKSESVAAPEILRANMAQQLVAAQAGLYQARQIIAADQQRLDNLKRQMVETPARSSTTEDSIAANTLLQQLQSSLLASQLKKIQLLMKYDPSYPLVKEVEAEIAQTQEAIEEGEKAKYVNTTTDRDPTYEYLRQDQAKTEADLASEQATADELIRTIRGMQLETISLDGTALKQEALLREAKANEGNYLLYLTKREQERTSDALDDKRIANVAIAVPAEVPALPARNPFSVILPGFFLAMLGGIGAGYIVEFADPSFRTPAEVEEMLNVTVLAAVPKRGPFESSTEKAAS